MRVLVIDDQRIFNSFPNLPNPRVEDVIVHETTSQDGLRTLYEEQPWDEVWLDHDLGMDSVGSGSDIVNAILDPRRFLVDVGKFYVHTMNPVGKIYMSRALGQFYDVETIDPTPYLDL